MSTGQKGKSEFTSVELNEIRELIRQKCQASRDEQKSIRAKMRKMGFYITDFVTDITSVEEFDNLVKSGTIPCIDK
ncbi:MAG: hypothetical protein K2M10_09690 [Muribaculaceae bacterium]|nr:hypothetical protein [Muribaculaceae bacterium]